MLERVGGSEAVLREILCLFFADCERLMNDIRASLANGDTSAVYRSAHTLRGSAGNFDADNVVALAQRLEGRAREGSLDASRTVFALLELEIAMLLSELQGVHESLR